MVPWALAQEEPNIATVGCHSRTNPSNRPRLNGIVTNFTWPEAFDTQNEAKYKLKQKGSLLAVWWPTLEAEAREWTVQDHPELIIKTRLGILSQPPSHHIFICEPRGVIWQLPLLFLYCFYFQRQCLIEPGALLALNFLCSWRRPWLPDIPASTACVLELLSCATTLGVTTSWSEDTSGMAQLFESTCFPTLSENTWLRGQYTLLP